MPSTPICLRLPFHPWMCPRYHHLPQTLPLLSTGTNTQWGCGGWGGGHAYTHIHTHSGVFPVLSQSTVASSQTQLQSRLSSAHSAGTPWETQGFGVRGSRGLKLILSLWSCLALFSLFSSLIALYRRLIKPHLQNTWKNGHLFLFWSFMIRISSSCS